MTENNENVANYAAIDLKTLKAFVSRSTITVSSEIEVFQAIVNWIEQDENSREHLMCDLLKMVRLPLLTCEVIQNLVKSNKFCQSCQKCCVYIDSVLADKRNLSGSYSNNLQHRCCIDNFNVFTFYSHLASFSVKPYSFIMSNTRNTCSLCCSTFWRRIRISSR